MKNTTSKKYQLGVKSRILVVGKKVAAASIAEDDFTRPMNEFLTENVWGSIWARPGLPRKTRLLINIGILAAINRQRELKRYTKAAILNGCTKEEIAEVLLQVGAYCGAPAMVEGFIAAREAIAEEEK